MLSLQLYAANNYEWVTLKFFHMISWKPVMFAFLEYVLKFTDNSNKMMCTIMSDSLQPHGL